jgi:sec-independent protein translocase protein TatB
MEILVIVMVALVVFGPEKLPQIARQIGRAAQQLRQMASEVKDEFQEGLDVDDPPEPRPDHPNVQNRYEGMPPALSEKDDDEDDDEDDEDDDDEIKPGAV